MFSLLKKEIAGFFWILNRTHRCFGVLVNFRFTEDFSYLIFLVSCAINY
jgi:hypothetical protein